MTELSITIPISAYKAFPPSVQHTIMAFVIEQFGGPYALPLDSPVTEDRDDKGLAKLDAREAKLFLNNCSERTTMILQEIVNHNGNCMVSAIHRLFGTTDGELRGAWSGLTKRVRTITKDPEASLLGWFKQGDDWRVVMAAQTVASMRIALSERG